MDPVSLTSEDYVAGILRGDRVLLGRAITLVESRRPDHAALSQEILDACMPHTGRSVRVGVSGAPGVGKSTFIEALGMRLVERGRRPAVLAVDPTSPRSRGSILGDKTRMTELAAHPNAFIRPSPTGGSLGGVARRTRETLLLCEAAGFDTVFVETVGVGQSEYAVASMVDFFLLLALAGAGDELQGIKRGIVEMADTIAITKADGDNVDRARRARDQYDAALRLFPPSAGGRRPRVLTCSAVTGDGIDGVWESVEACMSAVRKSGAFENRRREQARAWFRELVEQALHDRFFESASVREALPALEADVVNGAVAPTTAARKLLAQAG